MKKLCRDQHEHNQSAEVQLNCGAVGGAAEAEAASFASLGGFAGTHFIIYLILMARLIAMCWLFYLILMARLIAMHWLFYLILTAVLFIIYLILMARLNAMYCLFYLHSVRTKEHSVCDICVIQVLRVIPRCNTAFFSLM